MNTRFMSGFQSLNAADVQLFSWVVRHGSFSEAAQRLGITRSAVSKAVTRLEDRLGVCLLRRSTRKLSLTDAGHRFFKHAAEVDAALQSAEAAVAGDDQDVSGHLAVSLSTSFGAALLPRIIRDFRGKWPNLTLSLDFNDSYTDLIGGGLDLAIRIASRLDDSSLMSKRLATTREVLVASPGYLKKFGTPGHVDDLKNHRCIDIANSTRSEKTWRFREGKETIEVPVSCVMTATSDLPLILAACLDEGVLQMPELLVAGEVASGRLVEILPDFSDAREWGVFAVYPARKPSAKVRAFIDFVVQELAHLPTVDRWAPFSDPENNIERDSRKHRVA